MAAQPLQQPRLHHEAPTPHAHNGHIDALPAPAVHLLEAALAYELVEGDVLKGDLQIAPPFGLQRLGCSRLQLLQLFGASLPLRGGTRLLRGTDGPAVGWGGEGGAGRAGWVAGRTRHIVDSGRCAWPLGCVPTVAAAALPGFTYRGGYVASSSQRAEVHGSAT